MKWDNTQQWIANSNCLYGVALAYCSTGKKEVSKRDRETASNILFALIPDDVAEELETYLSCNKSQDERIFNVWADKLKKGLIYLSSLKHLLYREGNYEEEWSVIWNEHRIIEKENTLEFLWYLVISLDNRFQRLQSLAESITKSYGLANDTEFITALIRGNMPETRITEITSNKNIAPVPQSAKSTKSIYDIIQCEDKEGLVKRLHTLIDGKRGKDIAVVFIRAKIDGLITRYPTKGELSSEFDWKGTWQSIDKVLQRDMNNGVLAATNAIRFN